MTTLTPAQDNLLRLLRMDAKTLADECQGWIAIATRERPVALELQDLGLLAVNGNVTYPRVRLHPKADTMVLTKPEDAHSTPIHIPTLERLTSEQKQTLQSLLVRLVANAMAGDLCPEERSVAALVETRTF